MRTLRFWAGAILGIMFSFCPSIAVADTSTCTPALFERAAETMQLVNRSFDKEFHELQAAIADHPGLTDGTTVTWTRTMMSGVVEKTSLTQISAGNFSFEEDTAGEDSPSSFVKVVSATLSFTSGTGTTPSETKGSISIDFDALASVISTEPRRGQQSINFDMISDPTKPAPGKKETIEAAFTNLQVSSEDSHGPRTGNYTQVREPQIGEALQFGASMVLPCPANPGRVPSNIQTAGRQYTAADGTIHSRGDANAAGGQLQAGASWIEARCSEVGITFRLAKLEDAGGITLDGSTNGSMSACDPVFGPIPQLASNATDYNFGQTAVFPNEY